WLHRPILDEHLINSRSHTHEALQCMPVAGRLPRTVIAALSVLSRFKIFPRTWPTGFQPGQTIACVSL
nr:hypothetical protein [Streptomyces sp. DSM 41633]